MAAGPEAGRAAVVLLSVTAAGLAAVMAGVITVIAVFAGASAQSVQACAGQATPGYGTPAAGVGDMTPTQLAHAATWVGVGQRLGVPAQGIVVALATVSQESGFTNYANDGRGDDLAPEQRDVARSLQLPHDAVGSDHGSLGLAQQQYPWWGTLEELMDPATSAGLFYAALLAVPGWHAMTVTDAAQSVQRSLFGSAYADDEPLARQLLAELAAPGADPGVAGGLCGPGTAMTCPPTGLPAEQGLTPDALRVLRCVQHEFGEHTYGGLGQRPDNPASQHRSGRAVDVMITDWAGPGRGHGDRVAAWVAANAAALGVREVIWDARIWSVRRAGQGWRAYSHPSGDTSPTSLHRDHVHVTVAGNAAAAPGAAGSGEWVLPVRPGSYVLTSGYGPRGSPGGIGSSNHAGLDFAADTGTPVIAATSGEVTTAGPAGGFGNLVVITSGTVATYYAHQAPGGISVQVGQQVSAGQVIGAVGSTGVSTGPHLHFEVRVDGASTDPVAFLRQYGIDPGTVR